jgi:TonB-dependent starch-binding outer membrane protein SusC
MKRIFMLLSLLVLTGALVMGQTVQITGTVTSSEDNQPIAGASVFIKGTTIGALTGVDGKFALTAPTNAQSLVVSFIGFRTQEIPIEKRTNINVVLEQDVFRVDEVVVVAYGTQQKRDVTGSVSSIRTDAIQNIPVQSFDQALQGKAAGVSITMPNGVLNNPPVIRVRGFNSITGSSSPLIVVDGVPIFTGNLSGTNSFINALSDINPSDILSMDILKDASATAIYGSRAANGVILITTKRGTAGSTKVTYDAYVGYTQPYRLFDMMNSEQYIEHKNLARANNPASGLAFDFFIPEINGQKVDTRWADYVYQTGFQQNHALTISGATGKTNYFLSVGYTNQEGMVQKNSYERKNARLNMDHKVNKFLAFSGNFSISNGLSKAPNTGSNFSTAGAARLAFVLPPNLAPYLADGSYNIAGSAIGNMGQPVANYGYYNAVAVFDLNKFSTESNRMLGNISMSLTPFTGLEIKTSYGMDNLTVEDNVFQTGRTGDSYASNGYAYNGFNRPKRWTWTNTINYSRLFAEKYSLNLLAGVEEQYTRGVSWSGSKTNYTDPFFEVYQGSWVTAGMGGGGRYENYFLSYFGRISFDYMKKYYFETSVRRDGFSGLAEGNKFGTFGGASVMWKLSNESFIAESNINTLITDMRLKASYGRVGNMSGIGSYASLFLYSSGVYGAAPTWQFSQAGNPELQWEASDKFDIGFSFSLLKDRIQTDLNWYYNNINNLILDVPQAPSKGIPGNTVPANIGAMYNTGVELTVTTYNISKSDFSWTTNFNFSTLKNKVTALADGVSEILGVTGGLETTNRTLVGLPIGNIWAVETRGVDPATGRRIFVNKNGDEVLYSHENANKWTYKNDGSVAPVIALATDGKAVGSPLPKFYGGVDNNLTYKNLDFNVSLTYALGFQVYNGSRAGLMDQRWWNNSVEVYENAWKQAGDVTNVPKPVMNDNVSNGSAMPITDNVEDGNYMKIRTISAGYTFKNIPGDFGIQKVRLYTQVFNAFVLTKYTGSDPEVSTNGDTNLAPGIDRNSAPQARTYTFGINISF